MRKFFIILLTLATLGFVGGCQTFVKMSPETRCKLLRGTTKGALKIVLRGKMPKYLQAHVPAVESSIKNTILPALENKEITKDALNKLFKKVSVNFASEETEILALGINSAVALANEATPKEGVWSAVLDGLRCVFLGAIDAFAGVAEASKKMSPKEFAKSAVAPAPRITLKLP